jgi:hypothetical protein
MRSCKLHNNEVEGVWVAFSSACPASADTASLPIQYQRLLLERLAWQLAVRNWGN